MRGFDSFTKLSPDSIKNLEHRLGVGGGGGCSSAGKALKHWTGMQLMQVRFPSAARDFSPSQLSV